MGERKRQRVRTEQRNFAVHGKINLFAGLAVGVIVVVALFFAFG